MVWSAHQPDDEGHVAVLVQGGDKHPEQEHDQGLAAGGAQLHPRPFTAAPGLTVWALGNVDIVHCRGFCSICSAQSKHPETDGKTNRRK